MLRWISTQSEFWRQRASAAPDISSSLAVVGGIEDVGEAGVRMSLQEEGMVAPEWLMGWRKRLDVWKQSLTDAHAMMGRMWVFRVVEVG